MNEHIQQMSVVVSRDNTGEKVQAFKKHMAPAASGCIEWTGPRHPAGYGRFTYKRKQTLAHRAAWQLFKGDLPAADCVLHRCDNPPCVNPEHLFLGDRGDNARDMASKGRQWIQQQPERRSETLTCPPEKRARGSGHGNAKLHEASVLAIRARAAAGEQGRQLAQVFGVVPSLISQVIRGEIWQHVGGPTKLLRNKAKGVAAKTAPPASTAAPKSASTPSPAAHASATREAGAQRGKGKTGPAAQARATAPKTSKEEASAAIAAALSATGSHDVAPAAQGNEAPPVADAQATPPLVTVKRAKPTAPTADTPDAGAQAPVATHWQGSADAETGAALSAGVLAIGSQVKVLGTATGPKQAPHVGKLGTIQRQIGSSAWDVALPREKRSVPIFVAFDASELEVVL